MASPSVRYDAAGPVASLTLDSPHNRNALSSALVDGLLDGLRRAASDPDVRVVVLRAAGPVFCAGADLSEALEVGMEAGARALVRLQRTILTLEVPVVACVHGPVRAGGLGVVAAADVAIASDSASFAMTEARLGLAPAAVSVTVLARMTSRAASWACLTGSVLDARAAEAAGLVTRAVPADELDDAVGACATDIARAHPQGLRETKALLTAELVARLDASGDDLAALSARLFASQPAREAMARFLATRT